MGEEEQERGGWECMCVKEREYRMGEGERGGIEMCVREKDRESTR